MKIACGSTLFSETYILSHYSDFFKEKNKTVTEFISSIVGIELRVVNHMEMPLALQLSSSLFFCLLCLHWQQGLHNT